MSMILTRSSPTDVEIRRCSVCGRPVLVDVFAGEGGAGRGYQLAGWCVRAVDNVPARLDRYPLDCDAAVAVCADWHEGLLQLAGIATAVHVSPPCTGYSRGTAALPDRLDRYDRLIPAVRDVLEQLGLPYVLENVEDARPELVDPLTLCWTHFRRPGSVLDDDGTPLWMRRHRLFESNVHIPAAGECDHRRDMQCAGAYGGARRDKREAREIRRGGYVPSVPVMRELLGTPWMSEKGCQLSIPPSYTEHIGSWLLAAVGAAA